MRRLLFARVETAVAALLAVVVSGVTPSSAQPVNSGAPPVGTVLKEMPGDLWHFISWDTAAVVAIGGGAAAIGHIWDDDLAGELETNVKLNDAMQPGHTYGAFSFQAVIGVGLYATGRVTHHSKLAVTGADIMRAQILSQAYVQVLKYTVQRERPNGSNTQSFPSGHSAGSFATATVLQRHSGWKVGIRRRMPSPAISPRRA